MNSGNVKPVIFNTGKWNNSLVCKLYMNYAQQRKKKAFSFKKKVLIWNRTFLPQVFCHCHNRDLTHLCPAHPACSVSKWSLLWFIEGILMNLNIYNFTDSCLIFHIKHCCHYFSNDPCMLSWLSFHNFVWWSLNALISVISPNIWDFFSSKAIVQHITCIMSRSSVAMWFNILSPVVATDNVCCGNSGGAVSPRLGVPEWNSMP